MRAPLPFDTHAYVKRLVAAGTPEAQAEVQAEALAEIVLVQVVTKDDLRQAMTDLDRKIEAASGGLKADVREMELRLTARLEVELRKQLMWFFGMLVVLSGALVALLRTIPPMGQWFASA